MYMSKQIIPHLLSVGLALDYAAHIGVTYVVTKGKSRRERAQTSVSRFRSHPSFKIVFLQNKKHSIRLIGKCMADIYSCFIAMHCVIPAWGQLWLMEAYLPSWLSYSWPSATPMSILHSSRFSPMSILHSSRFSHMSILHSSRFSDKLNRNISKLKLAI